MTYTWKFFLEKLCCNSVFISCLPLQCGNVKVVNMSLILPKPNFTGFKIFILLWTLLQLHFPSLNKLFAFWISIWLECTLLWFSCSIQMEYRNFICNTKTLCLWVIHFAMNIISTGIKKMLLSCTFYSADDC